MIFAYYMEAASDYKDQIRDLKEYYLPLTFVTMSFSAFLGEHDHSFLACRTRAVNSR